MSEPVECVYSVEGDGPPLFLIHGIGAARDAWRLIVPRLIDSFTVVTYDLRGHGASPLPEDPFGLDELVTDLESVRARSGFEKAHFAGHSLGGMIGPAYARKYPDRVLSLGLLSTAAGRNEDDRAKLAAVYKKMEEDGIAATLEVLVDRWYTDEYAAANPDVVERRLKQVIDTNPDVFLNVFRTYAGTEMAPWLHEVQAPSLVLTGELDGACNPRLNKFMHEQLPDSELVILEGLKHSILIEAPDAVARHMQEFIEKRA